MNKPLKPAAQLLRSNQHLQRLFRQAEQLSRLQVLVHGYLSPAARSQARLGSYRDGVLTLVLEDAAWATRLRYQQERLVNQLQQHDEFAGLQRLTLKVRPAATRPAREEQEERRYLSEQASTQIRQSADDITDPRLRAALERLAGNVRKPAGDR